MISSNQNPFRNQVPSLGSLCLSSRRTRNVGSEVKQLGLWLRLECSLDCIIYVSEGFDVPRDYRSRRGRETIKRYDVTETYSHVVRQNLSETSITCAESC